MSKVIEQIVTPIYKRLICDCGGEMKFTGQSMPIYPARYTHICEKCGKMETMNEIYPCIGYGIDKSELENGDSEKYTY